MQKVRSFAPIAGPRSRILILGTMPGVKSLEKREYYGHPQNTFWKIIYAVFDRTVEKNTALGARSSKAGGSPCGT